ncbi:MAG: RNA polymerase sigma factor [Oscillospiraceae bacterium]|jgi:RNA polymerase sigma factor (sigma-70 family)
MVDQAATSLFNALYDATNRKVLSFIIAKCSNTADIRDLFQETYLELYALLVKRGTKYVKNGEALVMKLARQKVYRHYSLLRRLRPAVSIPEPAEEEPCLEQAEVALEDDAFTAALIAEIGGILSQKPQQVQKIFYLYYSLDRSIPEIAALLSMSEANVKNKLYRTIRELRELYTGKEGVNHERT